MCPAGGVRTMRTSLRNGLKPALSLQAAAATQLGQRSGSARNLMSKQDYALVMESRLSSATEETGHRASRPGG